MSLNKKKMVREIGRRTRIKNRDVQAVIEVWTEELINGGRIEVENFFALRTRTIDLVEHRNNEASQGFRRHVHLRLSNKLRNRLKTVES